MLQVSTNAIIADPERSTAERDESRFRVSRRAMLAGAGIGAASLLLPGCHRQARGSDVLRVSTVGKGEGSIDLMARSAGLRVDGLKLEYSNFQSGQLVIEALNGGSLDFGGFSEIPPVFAAASSTQSFRQIAVTHGDVNNQVILVPRGSRIESLADLKGKRVGYIRATTAHYFLVQMLRSVGLGWNDITPVAIGVSDGVAAFSSGALDAWAIYGFPIQRALAADGARILKTAYGFLSGNYLVAAHVDTLADPAKVELIGKYLRLVKRAYAWSAAHRDEWAAIVAKDIGVPLAYVRDEFHRASDVYSLRPVNEAAIRSQQAVADVFAAQKLIPHSVDVRPLWDDRFNSTILERD
jgi:sulfonate transport system substrate-binding protein